MLYSHSRLSALLKSPLHMLCKKLLIDLRRYFARDNNIILYCPCSKVDFLSPKINIIFVTCQFLDVWWLPTNFLPSFLQVSQVCQLEGIPKKLSSPTLLLMPPLCPRQIDEAAGDLEADSTSLLQKKPVWKGSISGGTGPAWTQLGLRLSRPLEFFKNHAKWERSAGTEKFESWFSRSLLPNAYQWEFDTSLCVTCCEAWNIILYFNLSVLRRAAHQASQKLPKAATPEESCHALATMQWK